MRRLSVLTGPDSAMARNTAISVHPIGLRSREIRYSVITTETTTSTVRRTERADRMGSTRALGVLTKAPYYPSDRTQQLHAQTGAPEQPRAGVRADHRPYLRDELRVAPVDLAAGLGEALGRV